MNFDDYFGSRLDLIVNYQSTLHTESFLEKAKFIGRLYGVKHYTLD
jgi:hypothetical protein